MLSVRCTFYSQAVKGVEEGVCTEMVGVPNSGSDQNVIWNAWIVLGELNMEYD